MTSINIYFVELEAEIEVLEKRLKELEGKFFKWGHELEMRILRFIISKKKMVLREAEIYRREQVAFREEKL